MTKQFAISQLCALRRMLRHEGRVWKGSASHRLPMRPEEFLHVLVVVRMLVAAVPAAAARAFHLRLPALGNTLRHGVPVSLQ